MSDSSSEDQEIEVHIVSVHPARDSVATTVQKTDTVEFLKDTLNPWMDLQPGPQRLIFEGNELED
eukprot:6650492-Heterocapsa_arctica.AAC.1